MIKYSAMEMVLAYVTAKDKAEAQRLAQGLLEKRLVACVNVFDGMTSFYWWKGKIEQGQEIVLVLKTRADKAQQMSDWIKSVHSYENPCVLFFPIMGGNPDYLKWLNSELGLKTSEEL
jgi:periplasmic divalent cation tolerance protein